MVLFLFICYSRLFLFINCHAVHIYLCFSNSRNIFFKGILVFTLFAYLLGNQVLPSCVCQTLVFVFSYVAELTYRHHLPVILCHDPHCLCCPWLNTVITLFFIHNSCLPFSLEFSQILSYSFSYPNFLFSLVFLKVQSKYWSTCRCVKYGLFILFQLFSLII